MTKESTVEKLPKGNLGHLGKLKIKQLKIEKCLSATFDTLLAGKLLPRAFVMAELMALVMAVWIWLLRAEMRMAPMILQMIALCQSAVKSEHSQAGNFACRKLICFLRTDLGTGKNVVIPISMPIPMQIMSWVLVKMFS